MQNLGNLFLSYIKPNYKQCEKCGKLVKIKSKNDHRTQYCSKCAEEVHREINKNCMRITREKWFCVLIENPQTPWFYWLWGHFLLSDLRFFIWRRNEKRGWLYTTLNAILIICAYGLVEPYSKKELLLFYRSCDNVYCH